MAYSTPNEQGFDAPDSITDHPGWVGWESGSHVTNDENENHHPIDEDFVPEQQGFGALESVTDHSDWVVRAYHNDNENHRENPRPRNENLVPEQQDLDVPDSVTDHPGWIGWGFDSSATSDEVSHPVDEDFEPSPDTAGQHDGDQDHPAVRLIIYLRIE